MPRSQRCWSSVFAAGGEWIARAEAPPLERRRGRVVRPRAAPAIAGLLMLHMAFSSGWTTMLLGAAAIVPALATRWRSYPVLGWMCGRRGDRRAWPLRLSIRPSSAPPSCRRRRSSTGCCRATACRRSALGFAAWQLARTTNGRPRLAMEAAAALFALLGAAMLVRHAMHGGVIDTAR